jgi:hypothetical protein
MQLWLDLLFGNPIGILSMVTVLTSLVIIIVLVTMLIRKSGGGT